MNMTFQHKIAKFAWSVVVTSSLFACNLDEELTSVYNADNAYVTEQNAQMGFIAISKEAHIPQRSISMMYRPMQLTRPDWTTKS